MKNKKPLHLADAGLISAYTPAPSEEIMLPMSDGTALYTVCRKPVGAGPFPTIIMRSCYPDQITLYESQALAFCQNGFAFVYQFCRGTGKSEGEWVPNVNERQDGKETLDWLAGQNWVESIGFFGCSYLAFTGWVLADILPEKVKSLYLTHYGTDRFSSAYQCGLFRQDVLTSWAMNNAGFPVEADYMESLKFRPQMQVDEKLWGQKIDWYREWISSTNRDDPYWNSGFWQELKEIPAKIKVPVYIGEGWYDHHLGSALRAYESLSETCRAHSVLRIGGWNHIFGPCIQGQTCDHLENDDLQSALDWFKTTLIHKQLPQGKVAYYEIGADRWQETQAFPFDTAQEQTFYLSVNPENGCHGLRAKPMNTAPTAVSYSYDPDHPVISHGCESLLATFTENGSLQQPPCGWRDDVISFVSDTLQEDLNLLGKVQVRLFVSSSAEDTAFTAKLMEVHPDGTAYNIRSSIATLAYRQGTDLPRMTYMPNSIVEVLIEMWDISWMLRKGSKLRLDISSSDFPQYAIHSNTAGIWAEQSEATIAQQTIFSGKAHPSRVILPIK